MWSQMIENELEDEEKEAIDRLAKEAKERNIIIMDFHPETCLRPPEPDPIDEFYHLKAYVKPFSYSEPIEITEKPEKKTELDYIREKIKQYKRELDRPTCLLEQPQFKLSRLTVSCDDQGPGYPASSSSVISSIGRREVYFKILSSVFNY